MKSTFKRQTYRLAEGRTSNPIDSESYEEPQFINIMNGIRNLTYRPHFEIMPVKTVEEIKLEKDVTLK